MKKGMLSSYLSIFTLLALLAISLVSCTQGTQSGGKVTVNLGYFPNITHAPALVGVQQGTFAKALGSGATLKTTTFNAGPALIQALFANSIDIGFVGPNPTIDGFTQSKGAALHVIAGATSGGASFIVRKAANIKTPADLAHKKFATPQLGNTQDVALRNYLHNHGLNTTDKGGNVQIIPTSNANIVTLFQTGKIDGAWVPEPYASQLVANDNGQVFVDERTLWPAGQFVTTNIVVRTAFEQQHPDLVKKFLQGYVDTIQFMQKNPTQAQQLANTQLKTLTGKALSQKVLTHSFSEMTFTYDPLPNSLLTDASSAYTLGFLGSSKPNLTGLYQLDDLNAILASKHLAQVKTP
jgi:NitT/TauT family transport system substrate-binding protein